MAKFALWIATILRSQGRARQLDLSFILWMSWMDLRGKDAAAAISRVQGRKMSSAPAVLVSQMDLRFLGLSS